jgi:hypothetical protein
LNRAIRTYENSARRALNGRCVYDHAAIIPEAEYGTGGSAKRCRDFLLLAHEAIQLSYTKEEFARKTRGHDPYIYLKYYK